MTLVGDRDGKEDDPEDEKRGDSVTTFEVLDVDDEDLSNQGEEDDHAEESDRTERSKIDLSSRVPSVGRFQVKLSE